MKKTILVCGLIAGAILGTLMAVSLAIPYFHENYGSGMIYGYASMLLAFSLIFVGVKNFRDNYNEGVVTFGNAFKIGLYITLICSTIYVGVWLIEYYFFIPDYMDKYAANMLKNMNANGLSQVEVDEKIKQVNSMKEMYKNPLFVILLTYLEVLPVGLMISLISAAILKRKSASQRLTATN